MGEFINRHAATIVLIGTLLALAVGFWLLLMFCEFRCSQAWQDSGHASRFNLWAGGCQIEVEPGRWIPEERYREFGDD